MRWGTGRMIGGGQVAVDPRVHALAGVMDRAGAGINQSGSATGGYGGNGPAVAGGLPVMTGGTPSYSSLNPLLGGGITQGTGRPVNPIDSWGQAAPAPVNSSDAGTGLDLSAGGQWNHPGGPGYVPPAAPVALQPTPAPVAPAAAPVTAGTSSLTRMMRS